MSSEGEEPPVSDSDPNIIMIIGAAVGGFFGLIILYVALKAVCSSCQDQRDRKRDALDKNKVQPKEQISTIKLQKPVVTYDGPTHNNIPVVRADDDPNSRELKKKTQPVRGTQRSLASSMIKERRENGGPVVDQETYATRREIENQIIENRRRQQLHHQKSSQDSTDSYGSGRLEGFHYVNEMNGHARTHRVFTDTLDDDRGRRPRRSKELDENVRNGRLIKDTVGEVPLADIPSDRQNGGPRVRDGGDLPKEESKDLSRFKPQDLPADWLPPSKKGRQQRSSPPSRKIAPVELDARDLRPDFRRGEEKKAIRKMNDSHANPSYEDYRIPQQDEFGGLLLSEANRPVRDQRTFNERNFEGGERDYARNAPRDRDPRDRDTRDRDPRDFVERNYQRDPRDDRSSRRQIDPREFRQGSDPSDFSERNFERRRDPRHERSSQRDPRDFAERKFQREVDHRDERDFQRERDRHFERSSHRERDFRDDFQRRPRDPRDYRQDSDPREFADRNYHREREPRDYADRDFGPQERSHRRPPPPVFARDSSQEELPQPIKKKKRRVITTS